MKHCDSTLKKSRFRSYGIGTLGFLAFAYGAGMTSPALGGDGFPSATERVGQVPQNGKLFGYQESLIAMTNQPSSSSSSDVTNTFSLPPPFSPEDFWSKLALLLVETKGFVRHEDFERVFKIEPIKRRDDSEMQGYSLTAGKDWYFDVGMNITSASYKGFPSMGHPAGISSELVIKIPVDAFGDWKKGQCILAGEGIAKLLDAGWTMQQKKVWNQYDRALMGDQLVLGNSKIYIKHYVYYLHGFNVNDDATCITELSVSGRPN